MLFDFTEEQEMMEELVWKWSVEQIGPIQEKIDEEDWFPPNFFKQLGELGILGITIDEKYGGVNQGIVMQCIALQQLSRICPALGLSYGTHSNLCAHNINRNANEKQKMKYLPPLIKGEKIGAMAITEPGAGSDAMGIKTTAKKEKDVYILNGTKTFITNASYADTFLIYAKTQPDRGARGISAFIVESTYPGFSVSKKFRKAGMRGSPTAEITFQDVEIPEENLVYKENMAVQIMTSGLAYERIILGAACLGIAQQALEYSIEYAKERVQFGKSISSFQMIQKKLADMYCWYETSRLLIYQAANYADTPEGSKGGGKGTKLDKLAASAILYTSEATNRITYEGVQIFGGNGYCLDYPIQKLWRDAKLYDIGAGTNEIRRIIIARELLKD